jgi:NAD(P)-dependent dehydrogenase (short-subunit alcohol dehydrogenase family)
MNELFGLADEPALVVGGGYGSGRELARLLAAAGARVAVGDIDPTRARRVAEDIGGVAVVGDITTEAGARAMVDDAHAALGGLTRVANIVGLVRFGTFIDTDCAHWEQQIRLNLYGQMYVAQAAGRHMLAAHDRTGRGGSIAMVASVSGIYGARNQAAYGIAKAGVMSLARTLSDEWAGHGIRINCIAPDITAVPRLTDAMPMDEATALARLDAMAAAEGVPMRRFGRAEELAKPLLCLLSEMSSFMTGQTLVIDGGTMVHFPHSSGDRRD